MGEQLASWQVWVGVILNFVTATGVIFLNRYLYDTGFHYVLTLTIIHYAVTWLSVVALVAMGLVEFKRIDVREILLFAVGFAITVPSCNASLLTNSVGTYQIFKALLSPTSVVIQMFYYNVKFSTGVLFSLGPICLGVVITGIADVSTSMIGVFFGLVCVFSSVLSQIWAEDKQKKLEINSMQLMLYAIPIAMVILVICAPFADDLTDSPHGIQQYIWTIDAVGLILGTAVFGAVINITIYFILKALGPVTYQVYGHTKTCTILLGSFVLFNQPLDQLNLFGMVITMLGAFMYTYYKLQESAAAKAAAAQAQQAQQAPPASTKLPTEDDEEAPSSSLKDLESVAGSK